MTISGAVARDIRYSAQMKPESLDAFEFPGGAAWRS
jgi:hypothetical protein